ncbi:MAG: type II toxin-antitoxin system VapB family antitoxin [Solirubrobacteraceae bacterium MAG38_C4-C5]|nr:type II toxin-antitoxin system VapB family antitoxin [Candidatus Siliceabacter maunaloa]
MNRRTTIVVDEALLADAQTALGTRGLKDTVDRALSEAVRAAARERLAARLESGDGFDRTLLDDQTRRAHWRG